MASEQNKNDTHPGRIFEGATSGIKSVADLLARTTSPPNGVMENDSQKHTPLKHRTDPVSLMNAIAALASSYLPGLKSGAMKPDDDFFSLGGSSVQAVELASTLAKKFGINLSLDDLFADARPRIIVEKFLRKQGVHVDALTDINDPAAADPVDPRMPEAAPQKVKSLRFDELDEELQHMQKEDIRMMLRDMRLADDLPWVEAPQFETPETILLTGANGFLGSHVLFDLLRHSDARVVCLVRAEDNVAAEKRLARELEKREFPWSNELKRRVTVVAGDLAKPTLGWDDALWDEHSASIDAIVNVAAAVDFVRGYRSLREMNVKGVMVLAELAVAQKIKPLHQVSSLAVFDEYGIPEMAEDARPARIERLFSGYDKTKWAAEAMLRRAREHGLCVTFLRPGGISGNTHTGVYNPKDLGSAMIAAVQSMRLMPEFRYMNAAPVEWISRIISDIVIDPESWGRTYHLIGEPVSMRQQIRLMTLSGMAVNVLPFEPWRLRFLERMEKDPIPHLEFLALALRNKATVKLMEAVMNWPAASAHRVDALIKKRNLPPRPKNDGPSQIQTLERLVKDGRATLPGKEQVPYLQFKETMDGTLVDIHTDLSSEAPLGGEPEHEKNCTFKFDLSVAGFYQLFQERRVDIRGRVYCGLLHGEPLHVEKGDFWVRPDDGVPLSHGFKHPLIKYKLLLKSSQGQKWWLEGMKTASPGLNLSAQARTLRVCVGREGEDALYSGEMVVPKETYVEEQINGIVVNPAVPEQEQYAAKMIWLGWFGGQLARGFMDPFLRVGGGILDILRTMKDKGE